MNTGTVHVRLRSARDAAPYAEFQLSETDLVDRVHPADRRTIYGTVAYQAAETAGVLSEMTPDEIREAVGLGWPAGYVQQVEQFRSSGHPPIQVGELAEATRDTGARSLWRCSELSWVPSFSLVERQPAAAATRDAGASHTPEQEAER